MKSYWTACRLALFWWSLTLIDVNSASLAIRENKVFSEKPAANSSIAPRAALFAKRHRLAKPDANFALSFQAQSAGERISLNLFEDESFVGVIAKTELKKPNSRLCQGTIEGIPQSYFILVENQGALAGKLFVPGKGLFAIQYEKDGWHSVSAVDSRKIPPCRVGRSRNEFSAKSTQTGNFPASSDASSNAVPVSYARTELPIQNFGGTKTNLTIINHLVVYTPLSRQNAGGTNVIEGMIDLAAADCNRVLENSGAGFRLNLVYKGEIEFYRFNPNLIEDGNMDESLYRFRHPTDDFMDIIHSIRNQYEADICTLVVNHSTDGYAGMATGPTYLSKIMEQTGFNDIVRDFLINSYVLIHEIGHNFGCHHDFENSFGASPVFGFGFGYRFMVNGTLYRDVMAYEPGVQIPYFSSPNILFQGVPIGIPDGSPNPADNVRVLDAYFPTLSAYRGLPANDDFANRIWITNANFWVYGSNTNASKETGEPQHGVGPGGRSIWWTWRSPISGFVTISTAFGTRFNPDLAVYSGNSVDNLTMIARTNANGYPHMTALSFNASKGRHYEIAVDTTDGSVEVVKLVISMDKPELVQLPHLYSSANGQFGFRIFASENSSLIVESSENLVNWTPIFTNMTPYGQMDMRGTITTNTYYRAFLVP